MCLRWDSVLAGSWPIDLADNGWWHAWNNHHNHNHFHHYFYQEYIGLILVSGYLLAGRQIQSSDANQTIVATSKIFIFFPRILLCTTYMKRIHLGGLLALWGWVDKNSSRRCGWRSSPGCFLFQMHIHRCSFGFSAFEHVLNHGIWLVRSDVRGRDLDDFWKF